MFALLSLALFACDKGIREEAIDAENILGRWRAVEESDYDWDDSDDDGACDVPMYLGIMTFEHDGRGVADNGEHFAWSLTGRRITVDYGFIPARLTVSEICERRMVWKVLATEAGSVKYYGRIVFERL